MNAVEKQREVDKCCFCGRPAILDTHRIDNTLVCHKACGKARWGYSFHKGGLYGRSKNRNR